jgi:hypothetical protein
MKKITVLIVSFLLLASVCDAQIPIVSVITTLAKKVLNALDLAVEKLQNETIELQNVQKAVENEMSQLQLDGITDWVQKTKSLYSEYYQELSEVKQVIVDYDKIKQVISLQEKIVSGYESAYALFKQDKHFSAAEINAMYTIYSGIIDQSLKNLEQALLVVNAFVTQMSDGARMNIINSAYAGMQKNYNDLKQFNNQNIQLSLQRATDANDVETVKQLYALP